MAAVVSVVWALVAAASASAAAIWVEPVVGPINSTNASATGITTDHGRPWVALSQGNNSALQVASLTGGAWDLSQPLNRDRQPAAGAITSVDGTAYLAWAESRPSTGLAQIHVSREFSLPGKLNNWLGLGDSLNFNELRGAEAPSITDVNGLPWVAWDERTDTGGYTVYVAHLNVRNGRQWVYTPGPISVCAPSPFCLLLVAPTITSVNGTPWLSYNGPDGVHVLSFTGSGWVPRGVFHGGFNRGLANIAGTPYLSFTLNGGGHQHLHVWRFDADNLWRPVGNVTNSAAGDMLNVNPNEDATYGGQITAIGGVPYVVWSEEYHLSANSAVFRVHVKQFNDHTWIPVGDVLNIDPNQAAIPGGIADVGGQPYVAITQSQTDYGSAVRVLRATFYGPRFSSLTHSGPTLRVVLSEPATIRLDFSKPATGRNVAGVCTGATRSNGNLRNCTRSVTVGHLSFRGQLGVNTLHFQGRLSNGRLNPGRYTVTITATDAAGLRSVSRSATVTV